MSTPKLITVTWRLKRSYMEFIKILVKIVLRWGVRSAWRIVTFIWKEVTIATLTFRNLKRKTLVPEHPYNIKSRVVILNRFFGCRSWSRWPEVRLYEAQLHRADSERLLKVQAESGLERGRRLRAGEEKVLQRKDRWELNHGTVKQVHLLDTLWRP